MQVTAAVNISVDFVLATRHRKNERSIVSNGKFQCVVRCRIASMQANHGVNIAVKKLIFANIGNNELQIFVTVLFGKFVAIVYNISFQVIPDNTHVTFEYFGKVVIHDKR